MRKAIQTTCHWSNFITETNIDSFVLCVFGSGRGCRQWWHKPFCASDSNEAAPFYVSSLSALVSLLTLNTSERAIFCVLVCDRTNGKSTQKSTPRLLRRGRLLLVRVSSAPTMGIHLVNGSWRFYSDSLQHVYWHAMTLACSWVETQTSKPATLLFLVQSFFVLNAIFTKLNIPFRVMPSQWRRTVVQCHVNASSLFVCCPRAPKFY